jgi:hypothetical protein
LKNGEGREELKTMEERGRSEKIITEDDGDDIRQKRKRKCWDEGKDFRQQILKTRHRGGMSRISRRSTGAARE